MKKNNDPNDNYLIIPEMEARLQIGLYKAVSIVALMFSLAATIAFFTSDCNASPARGTDWSPIQIALGVDLPPASVVVPVPEGCDTGSVKRAIFARLAYAEGFSGGVLIFEAELVCTTKGAGEHVLQYSRMLPYPGPGALSFEWSDGSAFTPVEVE